MKTRSRFFSSLYTFNWVVSTFFVDSRGLHFNLIRFLIHSETSTDIFKTSITDFHAVTKLELVLHHLDKYDLE